MKHRASGESSNFPRHSLLSISCGFNLFRRGRGLHSRLACPAALHRLVLVLHGPARVEREEARRVERQTLKLTSGHIGVLR